MVKIYKQKSGKLILYLPPDVIRVLGLDENEEVDFFKYNDKSFLIAKKSEISNMLSGKPQEATKAQSQMATPLASKSQYQNDQLSGEEIAVLRKLDTIRYNMRTKENVEKLLSESERSTLNQLLKRKAVNLFQGNKSSVPLYGIAKNVYDKFLMRKKPAQQAVQKPSEREFKIPLLKKNIDDNPYVVSLEEHGFIILQTEAEATSLSLTLEESIRQGFVLGTRAFNRKFYIVLRSFIEKDSAKIIKSIRAGNNKVPDISKEVNLPEDGVRAILYLLSENGDVSEKKRDYFVIA